MGERFVITGTLQRTPAGIILKVDGGGFWAIFNPPWRLGRYLDCRVTVHGTRCGFNELWLEKIMAAG